MKMILDKKIESGNVLLRWHWAKRSLERDEYQWLIKNAKSKYQNKKYKTIVRIISYRKRLLDLDNLHAGVKHLLDALIKEKLVYDDSPQWCDLHVEQKKDDHERTELRVVRVDE